MAVWTAWPINVSSGSPSYSAQALRDTESIWNTVHPTAAATRPLGARSGRRPFSWNVTLSGSTIQIGPGAGILDVETPTATGAYRVSSDVTDTSLTLSAAHATLDRYDIVCVKVNDNDVDGSALRSAVPTYTAGTASGSPALPAVPARSMMVGWIFVPHTGAGSPAVTMWSDGIAVASGGITPISGASGSQPTSLYQGLYWDDAILGGLVRSDGTNNVLASARSYGAAPADYTLTASLTSMCSVTLPPGNWQVTGSGYFDFSTATARTYAADLYNSTSATVITAHLLSPHILAGQFPECISDFLTLTVSSVIQFRGFCSVVDGSQFLKQVKLMAINAGPLN